METNNTGMEERLIDPLGIELIVSVLSLAIGTISAIYQFGLFSKKDKRIRDEFKLLRQQVLRLQNSLDDIILTFDRYSNYDDRNINYNIFHGKITISSTIMKLKEKDYIKWLDIKESLHTISQNVYTIIAKLRTLNLKFEIIEEEEFFNKVIVGNFDELLINFSKYNIGEFLSKLRKNLSQLENYLLEISKSIE